MISAVSKYTPRWLMGIIATALVLATVVGSNQDSAEAIDPADTDTVYIADGTNFADALMGATIASLNTSPMLGVAGTNSGDVIPGDTEEELDRLTNNRASPLDTIYIFGGNQAVSDSVASQLGDWANDVQRIEGDSRWGTYEAISQMLPSAVDEAVHAQEADHATTADSATEADHATEADNADTLDGMDSTEFAAAPKSTSQTAWCGRADFFPDFDPGDGNDDEGYSETSSSFAGVFRNYRRPNPAGGLICTLEVPEGATLTRFAVIVVDDSGSENVTSCRLHSLPLTGADVGDREELADAGGTSGQVDDVQVLETTSFTSATVDRIVSLEADCNFGDDLQVGVIGALVEFTAPAVPLS